MVSFLFLICTSVAQAQHENHHTHTDSHAPISIMGEHTHPKGEWMVSYRYMHMDMDTLFSGTKQLAVEQVHNDYMVSPVDMTMEMHMLGIMYAPSDEFTVMMMVPYQIKDMEHRRRSDSRQFSTHAQGIGDVSLTGIYSLKPYVHQDVNFNFGLFFPTGSINEKDQTLLGFDRDLPYPMQLGSGTFDIKPGLTYVDQTDRWAWGAKTSSLMRLGKNAHKYRLGHDYEITSWFSYKWQDWVSTSMRVDASLWGKVNGSDSRLNAGMVPTANAGSQGGERIDVFLGANFVDHQGRFKGHQLALEFGFPVYQRLNGPQLGAGLQGTIGWQKSF